MNRLDHRRAANGRRHGRSRAPSRRSEPRHGIAVRVPAPIVKAATPYVVSLLRRRRVAILAIEQAEATEAIAKQVGRW